MPNVFYDAADINKIVAYYSGDTGATWAGMTKLPDPDGSFIVGLDIRHHKIVGSTITEMSAGEKSARPLPDLIIRPNKLAVGTTEQRDATTPFAGAFWCNTDSGLIEFYNGSAWAPVGYGPTPLDTQLISSAQATVDIEGAWWNDYDFLLIRLKEIVASSDNVQLRCRFKMDGSYVAGADDYLFSGENLHTSGETLSYNTGWDYIPFMNSGIGLERDEAASGSILVHNPGSILEQKHIEVSMGHRTITATKNEIVKMFGTYRGATSTPDPVTDLMGGLRLYMETGNVERMHYKVEGINF